MDIPHIFSKVTVELITPFLLQKKIDLKRSINTEWHDNLINRIRTMDNVINFFTNPYTLILHGDNVDTINRTIDEVKKVLINSIEDVTTITEPLPEEEHFKHTRLTLYQKLYDEKMVEFLIDGLDEDTASRRSNIYAVQHTEEEYIKALN